MQERVAEAIATLPVTPDVPGCSRDTLDKFGADRKSTRLNSSHSQISYAVFCLKKKNKNAIHAYDVDLDSAVVVRYQVTLAHWHYSFVRHFCGVRDIIRGYVYRFFLLDNMFT